MDTTEHPQIPDELERKERNWSPVVIRGGRDTARRLVLVASNDDLTASRPPQKTKRGHGRGLRGPMRWKR